MAVAIALLRVLVVDDDAEHRALIRRMLERIGTTQIIEAPNGLAGVASLKQESVDIVICDWRMPVMSGIDMLKAVRAEQPRLPFIMLSGRADEVAVTAAKDMGVSAYLVKPVTPEKLKLKITQVFARLGSP